MMTKLTYKKKYRLLIVALIVFCMIIYRFALSKTIHSWQAKTELSRQASLQQNAPARIAALRKQIARYDRLIGSSPRDSSETRQLILEQTGSFCSRSGSCLTDLPDPVITERPDFAIETNIIVLEGNFANLLEYVYETETCWRPGKIVSARFVIVNDLKTNTKLLNLYVYIQKIKKNKPAVMAANDVPYSTYFVRSSI